MYALFVAYTYNIIWQCFNIIIYKLLKEYNDVIREVRILSHLKNGLQILKGQTDEKLNLDG